MAADGDERGGWWKDEGKGRFGRHEPTAEKGSQSISLDEDEEKGK